MNTSDYNNLKFYEELGFKSGVEIHQQLLTEKKLFCKCPAGKYSKIYDAEVLRHMRPTLSELGEYDGCALMEFKTKKEVVYRLNRESVCTYEMDDTPPFLVNQEGLDSVIEIALLLNCSIVDEMHISRKQYLDGSIPTGFQRTAVVGINGWIPFKGRKIQISHICYEEDACRQLTNIGHQIVFRTDRLGMPLIEVITMADMKTPQEVAEVITEIGRLIRCTGKTRRGLGSVRQDVNASIAGGSRVEIKGVPQISWIPRLLHNEAMRQKSLLEIQQLLGKRSITVDTLVVLKTDLSKIMASTKSDILKNNLSKGNVIGGIKLEKLAGILNHPAQLNTTFADEIAGRVRVIACLDTMPNLFHTDNYPNYEGSGNDLALINKELKIGKDDVGVITWGNKQDVETALEEVRLRVIDAIKGIPNETQRAFKDGTMIFERILPGPNRMYPDTDSPPAKITVDRVEKIKMNLPEPPWKKEERYKKAGISYYVARELAVSEKASLADKILSNGTINPNLVGILLTQQFTGLNRIGVDINKIPDGILIELFNLFSKGLFYKEAIPLILEKAVEDNSLKVKDIISKLTLKVIPDEKLHDIINQAIKKYEFQIHKKDNLLRMMIDFYAGNIIKEFKGMINVHALRTALEKALSNYRCDTHLHKPTIPKN